MESFTITIDQKWVDELIKRLDKYHMFKDRNQKIWEMVKTTANDEAALKKGEVTQTMVEGWCREHKVKLVESKNLEHHGDHHNTSWMDCPALWIRPYDPYSLENGPENGICPSHAQCWECSKCIDPMEGGIWGKEGENTCSACRTKYKLTDLLPGSGPEIDVNRPEFTGISAKKKVRIQDGSLEKHSHEQLKRTAAENGMDSSGTKKELVSRLYEYLELHGRFKRDLKVSKVEQPKAVIPKKVVSKVEPKAKVLQTSKSEVPPKKVGAYTFYSRKRRPELKKKYPTLSFDKLTVKIAGEWAEMTDTAKKPFVKLALEDKKRYEKEKKEYEAQETDEE